MDVRPNTLGGVTHLSLVSAVIEVRQPHVRVCSHARVCIPNFARKMKILAVMCNYVSEKFSVSYASHHAIADVHSALLPSQMYYSEMNFALEEGKTRPYIVVEMAWLEQPCTRCTLG